MTALIRSGGHGHRIRYMGCGIYRLSWCYDTKLGGTRLRSIRTMTRDTDRAGAERFAAKWGVPVPEVAP